MSLDKYSKFHAHLASRVVGQADAIAIIAKAILAGEMGHTPKGAPKGFLLILGPTGTGKTKAVLEASKYLYGTDQIARLNMAEFGSEDGLNNLLPTLANGLDTLQKAGGRFLLLDEIEKAHPRASDIFLGMEAALISDPASGRKYDLSELTIFVTSNVGARDLSELDDGVPFATVKRVVQDAASTQFRPEVFARFTHVVIYRKLTREAQVKICRQMLDEEVEFQEKQLLDYYQQPVKLNIGEGVFRRLISEGYSRDLGVRPMRNVIGLRVRNAITEARLKYVLRKGTARATFELQGDEVVLVSNQLKQVPGRLPTIIDLT